MNNNVRKYILIPEYRPLYAMRSCYGPPHGPLSKPCPTPLDVIGKLLKQSGNEALTIMEVTKLPNGTFSEPVKLTLNNYILTYDEIKKGMTIDTGAPAMTDTTPTESSKPNIVDKDLRPEPPVTPKNMFAQLQQEKSESVQNAIASQIVISPAPETPDKENEPQQSEPEQPAVEATEQEPEVKDEEPESTPATEPEDHGVKVTADPYAGMTKAERKAARRAAAAEAAAKEALSSEENKTE